jgi:hypothetical protein
LEAVAELLANQNDSLENTGAEKILSRLAAELQAEFVGDKDSDYLKLAQMLDPCVSYQTESTHEIDRLSELAKK